MSPNTQVFQTVFDLSRGGFGHWWLLAIFASLAIGSTVIGVMSLIGAPRGLTLRMARPLWLVGAMGLFGLAIVGSNYWEYRILRNALINGSAFHIEGTVKVLVPMPYEGHKDETVAIGDHVFQYSDYTMTPAFSQTVSHGGPLRQGRRARIWYFDGKILKVDVQP